MLHDVLVVVQVESGVVFLKTVINIFDTLLFLDISRVQAPSIHKVTLPELLHNVTLRILPHLA